MIKDNMISCSTKLIIEVNDKLLNCEYWEKNPKLIKDILTEVATQNDKSELTTICQKYLKVINKSEAHIFAEKDNKFILVLGKVLNDDASMKETLIKRLDCAYELYKKNNDLKIITSGSGEKLGMSEAQAMKNWLVKKGVPGNNIILESKSSDTMQNIAYSTDILIENKASEVTLITSEDHIFRALSLLQIYSEEKKHKLKINKSVSKKYEVDGFFHEGKENFILFKDIGRILNLWDYETNMLTTVPLIRKIKPK